MTSPAEPTVAPGTGIDEETLTRLIPPYNVILHNDDHNSMDHVVKALLRSVPSLSTDDSVRIMFEAHENGTAVVISCPKETAEMYRDRLESFNLTATIEPA
jgi:ATP-dependent Clp protease adaptor protein ClpS